MLEKSELCNVSKTHSKYIANKKNPHVRVIIPQGKNVEGKVCLSKYEMPHIIFQVSVTTSQDNFVKIL